MDRQTVECMSKVAGLLAQIKGKAAVHLERAMASPESLKAYTEIRELIGDCQEVLAVHCDCAPIRLISGRVDEIMENLEFKRNLEKVPTQIP